MPECAKTHLQQSRISKFSGGGPPDPLFKGRAGKGKGGRRGRGKRREGGRRKIGKGGEGREGTGEGGRGGMGVGRGGEGRSTWAAPPLETSSGSPCLLSLPGVNIEQTILLQTYAQTPPPLPAAQSRRQGVTRN